MSGSTPEPLAKRVRLAVFRLPVISVFVLVALWNVSVSSNLLTQNLEGDGAIRETLRELRNMNLHVQLRLYQALTSGRPIRMKPEHVVLVYIDDNAHWTDLKGVQPTDRAYLGRLITLLSTSAHAAVVGLDFELLAPKDYEEGTDDELRASQNKVLLDAIEAARAKNIAVVLGGAYVGRKDGLVKLPTIYSRSQLNPEGISQCPRCPQYGYINAPSDRRLLPGDVKALTDGKKMEDFKPFSDAVADAYLRRKADNEIEAGEGTEPRFGTFLNESEFPRITALELQLDPSKLAECDDRIVLIGGHWHDLQGYGDMVDTHLSPAGQMSGLALHANYVESLIQGQTAHEVPLWLDIVMDIVLGLVIYVSFELSHGWEMVTVLVLAFTLPMLFAYAALVMANVYLDFLFPIELYFLHILYEMIEDYVHVKHHASHTT